MSELKISEALERRLYPGAFHPELEDSFVAEVQGIRNKNPLSPIIVLVGSNLLGLYLRRLLARRSGSIFNIRFLTFLDLARALVSDRIFPEGRRELPPLADKLIIEELLKKLLMRKGRKLEYFSEIAAYDGFRDAILATIEDLKEAGINHDDFKKIAGKIGKDGGIVRKKLSELSTIYSLYSKVLEEKTVWDRADLIVEAIAASKYLGAPVKRCFGNASQQDAFFLLYGFYDFNFIQMRFLEECIRGVPCIAFFPHGESPAHHFSRKTLSWFQKMGFRFQELHSSAGHENQGRKDDSFQIVSAPGENREIREVLRRIMSLIADGVRFDEIGILLRNREDYASLLGEIFDENEIPYFFSMSCPLSRTRTGKSLLLFLELPGKDYYRRDVMHFLTFADLDFSGIFDDSFTPSVSEWEAISMKAGIVHGREEWVERLKYFIDGMKKIPSVDEDGEVPRPDDARGGNAEYFLIFLERFFSAIDSIPVRGKWSEISGHLLSSFRQLVKHDENLELIEAAVRELNLLETFQETTTISQYQRFLSKKLESSFIRKGKFQSGALTISDLATARGITFRIVLVPGLVEKKFPAFIRQDPILLDKERSEINNLLPEKRLSLKMERLEEEKLLFDLLISSASEKLVLFYPRMDPDTASERVPSFFLLKAAEAITGRKVDYESIERLPFFMRCPLSQLFPDREEDLINELECHLRLMTDAMDGKKNDDVYFLSRVSPSFRNVLMAERARWGIETFTSYDGVLSGDEARSILASKYRIFNNTVSASSLEMYAACPFRYFCNKILNLELLAEPEEITTISPLDRGSLIHGILFELFGALKREGMIPLKSESLPVVSRLLHEISRDHFEEMEKRGVTGFEMMWRMEKEKILEDLRTVIRMEIEEQEDHLPSHFEVRFGMPGSDEREDPISMHDPVPFEIDEGRKVLFKGRIDRIDLSKDGRRGKVIDYKSGGVYHKSNKFMKGQALQLPIYILAAEEIMRRIGKATEVLKAEYFYVTRKGEFERKLFDKGEWSEKMDSLKFIIQAIAESIEKGIFFQTYDGNACRLCDFTLLCGTAREIRFNRKAGDPIVNNYILLRSIE
ncbi:MAG: PD-(D/E)XK nuclease family protein [Acidobacteriota bacterium]